MAGYGAQTAAGSKPTGVEVVHIHIGEICFCVQPYPAVGFHRACRRFQGEVGGIVLPVGRGVTLNEQCRQVEAGQLKHILHRRRLKQIAVECKVSAELFGLHHIGHISVGAQGDETGHLHLQLRHLYLGQCSRGVNLGLQSAVTGQRPQHLAHGGHKGYYIALAYGEYAFEAEGCVGLHCHAAHGEICVGLQARGCGVHHHFVQRYAHGIDVYRAAARRYRQSAAFTAFQTRYGQFYRGSGIVEVLKLQIQTGELHERRVEAGLRFRTFGSIEGCEIGKPYVVSFYHQRSRFIRRWRGRRMGGHILCCGGDVGSRTAGYGGFLYLYEIILQVHKATLQLQIAGI